MLQTIEEKTDLCYYLSGEKICQAFLIFLESQSICTMRTVSTRLRIFTLDILILNMGKKLKTEHSGAKNGGGHWGYREEAKSLSKSARRRNSKKIIQDEIVKLKAKK